MRMGKKLPPSGGEKKSPLSLIGKCLGDFQKKITLAKVKEKNYDIQWLVLRPYKNESKQSLQSTKHPIIIPETAHLTKRI